MRQGLVFSIIVSTILCAQVLAYDWSTNPGDGSPANPYQISTVNDWVELTGASAVWNKHFILMADIDFEGVAITPVALDTNLYNSGFQGTSFTGTFDGRDHVLKNYIIHQPARDYVGLFGRVDSGGEIRNLGVEPLKVTGRSYVGSLCGDNYYGTITSCYATGTVHGTSNTVGGLCGNNSGAITSCYATGAVGVTSNIVGGLCGQNSGAITSCYATGTVRGSFSIGGLCGSNSARGEITSCYATGAVSGSSSYVGGLCGNNDYGAIASCYATGAVSGTSSYVGGLCGKSTGKIINSFWDIQASGRTTSAGGTGKSTAEMKDINSFLTANWDFTVSDNTPAVWYIPESNYPKLTCQLSVEAADVTGLPLTEAATQLIQTWPGLNVVLSIEASDTIAEGHVIRQIPLSGSSLPGNSTVSIVIAGKPSGCNGSGTIDDPYQIDTPSEWLWLIQRPSDWNTQFTLTADLDFGGGMITPVAPDTNSSKSGFQGTSFTGMLDGRGHVLRNFVIHQPVSDYVGLFGKVGSGGQIRNLGFEALQVTGRTYVSGLCGENYQGTITSCYATGAVNGTSRVGGLCGYNDSGTITSCYATGAVSGTYYVGGLCGYSDSGTFTSCYASGTVSGTSSYVGGLFGCNNCGEVISCYAMGSVSGYGDDVGGLFGENSGTITSCYATGAVSGYGDNVGGLCGENLGTITTCCYATGTVSGDDNVGGLCGENSGTITSCYATGAVNGSSEVGGLCGYNDSSTITSCYATGAVSGMSYLGGLCGRTYFGTITLCYATGAVSGTSIYVGGLCGYNDRGTITLCYATGVVMGTSSDVGGLCGKNCGTIGTSFWDIQTSGATTSDGGTGKTTGEMKDMNTFIEANWDFAVTDNTPAIWYMPEGGYPGLTCQLSVEVADVTGLHLKEVAAQLVQPWPGLNVLLSAEASDTIAEGYVIRQTPLAGSSLPGNSTVLIVIACEPSGYSGSGTIEDPYQIDTPSDWLWLIQRPSDWNKQFILTTDLDFGGVMIPLIAPDTSPSSGFQGTSFTGVLDGGGHVLRNFVICQPASDYVGLFGKIGNGGQIRNLGVESIKVTGWNIVGGLCGITQKSTITSCYATGTVSGASCVGGLCGYSSYGTTTSCYATGTVNGTSLVGGLCGENSGTITSCYATGAVSGYEDYVGGLCGENLSTITSCYATGTVNGTSRVGGLCGYSAYGTTTSCYATGAVSGTSRVGGLYGYNDSGKITSCYATGAVSGTYDVGGLCGYNDYGAITSCYATGAVRGTKDVGGLCGDHYSGTIITSFWNMQTSGMTTSDGGTGKTTAEMQMLATFISAGWDFLGEDVNGTEDIWFMRNGIEYPRLAALNHQPEAKTGSDQTIFAWVEWMSEVGLDGTGSYDEDGDALEYYWYNDAGELIATGAEPNVILEPGEHVIDLIVNDGIEDSEPNSVVVTVIEALKVPVNLTPVTLNCRSQGNSVKAHFVLPEEYSISDIDLNKAAVVDSYGIESAPLEVFVNKDKCVEIIASFGREAVCSLAGDWPQVFRVYGFFADGSVFFGESGIRINPAGLEEVSELALYWMNECEAPKWCEGLDLNRDSMVNLQDYPMLLSSEVEFITE